MLCTAVLSFNSHLQTYNNHDDNIIKEASLFVGWAANNWGPTKSDDPLNMLKGGTFSNMYQKSSSFDALWTHYNFWVCFCTFGNIFWSATTPLETPIYETISDL